jgi:hypothetical protein
MFNVGDGVDSFGDESNISFAINEKRDTSCLNVSVDLTINEKRDTSCSDINHQAL